KPGKDVHNPEKYRLSSLLPIPGKILEKTILKRFQDFAEEHALIPNYQFGFRARHSCNLQLMRKVETILTAWNKNSQVAVFYFDIARAFDSVWHLGLVWKFIRAGFPIAFCGFVYSYLRDRFFKVRVEDSYSEEKKIHRGVPQGSVVAPYFFNLFMSDLPNINPCSYFQYAADTAIAAISRKKDNAARKLQTAVDLVSGWFTNWKMDLNVEKCATMLYSRRYSRNPTVNIILNGANIEWTDRYKYLGITFDRQLVGNSSYVPKTAR
ncbi:reverse transcriptase family protein, partial [Salmonella enterica subsp. enterica serovar Derby]|nr:reverse transcriptase family protein [Salmonella enterica subsp. enterica serovar Derby]